MSQGPKWKWLVDPFDKIIEFELEPGLKYQFSVILGPNSKMRAVSTEGRMFGLANMGDTWTHPKYEFVYDEDYDGGFGIQYIGQIQNLNISVVGVDFEQFK